MPLIQRTIATALIPVLVLTALPLPAQAGMVSTEQAIASTSASADRDRLGAFLSRDDVRLALTQQGVDADEAIARVQAMSDAEVAALAHRVDEAPAGAGIVGALFTVFVILLVTDILGLTRVFSFTRPVR